MRNKRLQHGFSLVEIMVSVGIFAFVVTAGLGAVLGIVDANQKAQSLNSVMSNLNTALEDMARNIRTGSNYTATGAACGSGATGIQFTPQSGTGSVIYQLNSTTHRLEVNTSADPVGIFTPITAPEVSIDSLCFYFYGNGQPKAVLTMKGHVQARTTSATTFYLQTTMSQRLLPSEEPAKEF